MVAARLRRGHDLPHHRLAKEALPPVFSEHMVVRYGRAAMRERPRLVEDYAVDAVGALQHVTCVDRFVFVVYV